MTFGLSIPIFFITMREALEAAVVVSILLSFIHQSFPVGSPISKRMSRLVWAGTLLAIAICIVVGAAFLVVWFKYATNLWKSAELLWEGIEGLVAAVMLTVLAFGFLQSDQITAKWNKKLRKAFEIKQETNDDDDTSSIASTMSFMDQLFTRFFVKKNNTNKKRKNQRQQGDEDTAVSTSDMKDKPADGGEILTQSNTAGYTMFILPFITVLREGLELMVFVGGIGIASDPGTIPLAAVLGLIAGAAIGYAIYKAGNSMTGHQFFVWATIFVLLLSVGLLTRSVGKIQTYQFQRRLGTAMDITETQGLYDVNATMWFLNCCNPEEDVKNNYGWQFLSAILGWNNNGTYWTVGLYIAYCLGVSLVLIIMKAVKVRKLRFKLQQRLERERLAYSGGASSGAPGPDGTADELVDQITAVAVDPNVATEVEGKNLLPHANAAAGDIAHDSNQWEKLASEEGFLRMGE